MGSPCLDLIVEFWEHFDALLVLIIRQGDDVELFLLVIEYVPIIDHWKFP